MNRFSLVVAVISLMALGCGGFGATRSSGATPPDRFPPNPLTLDLPALPPLSPQQQAQIESLNQQAIAQLQAGNAKAAFELWHQQLRLSRALGPIAEVKALAAVGQTAWTKGDTQEVRYISQRLQQIQQSPDGAKSAVLTELAAAYQVIRAPQLALGVYDRLRPAATDPLAQFQLLNRIAQTHLDWFDYAQATTVYDELLAQAKTANDRPNQLAYAYQLAYIHEQAQQPAGAIAALETLIPLYAATPEPLLLPRLQTRLAAQYQRHDQPALAEKTYQAAYRSAAAQKQPGFAGDALRQLGAFYRSQKRLDAAIQVYDFLTTFEPTEGLNRYNTMDAYDRLGQVWLEKSSKPQAIAAFQQGLALAQGLNYRVDYFTDRLAKAQATGP
jgi:tetratricopeptide (TPR) repeat protein